MSNNRKFAIVILVVWVAILIALPAWAMSDTFPTFYQEGLSKGLAGYQSVFSLSSSLVLLPAGFRFP